MKVLFLCNLIPDKPGAFEQVLAALGREAAARGDRLVIGFAGEPVGDVARLLEASGTAWHVLSGWTAGDGVHPWRFVLPACRLVRAENPDVVVVHFGNELPAFAASALARLCAKRPKWVWQQDQQIADPSGMARRLSRLKLLDLAGFHFVTVYEGGRRSLALRGIRGTRIAVIPNSVQDYPSRRAAGWLRHELAIPAGTVVAVTVSSLIPRKRVDFQLRALGATPVAGAPLHLVVVGDGPERPALMSLADSLARPLAVHFLGRRQDVRDILIEADLLLHSSTAEACAYTIAEAMAAGLPVVVTEAGAAREQIDDGRTGYVVPRDDLAGFAAAIGRLCNDVALRRSLGTAAREKWERLYRLETAARKYLDLYRQLARR